MQGQNASTDCGYLGVCVIYANARKQRKQFLQLRITIAIIIIKAKTTEKRKGISSKLDNRYEKELSSPPESGQWRFI